jgi:hypothetical protein
MKYFFLFLFTLPSLASAAAPTDFKEFVELLLRIIQNTIGILMTAIVVGILYAIVLYMVNSDDVKKREEIKGYLIYAVIGLSVIMTLWGIIAIFTSTLGWGIGIPQLTEPS